MRHIETLEAQTGPVFLTYRQASRIDTLADHGNGAPPVYDFPTNDGVRHIFFVVEDPGLVGRIQVRVRRRSISSTSPTGTTVRRPRLASR